jgi:5-methylcytosine-specific restriction endonuclease McrA
MAIDAERKKKVRKEHQSNRASLYNKVLKYWIEDGFLSEVCDRDIHIANPQCWCCGRPVGDPKEKHPKNRWHKSGLQICHIVPVMLGGDNDPSNLFLMCERCHLRAPDSVDYEAFLDWVNAQEWYGATFIAELRQSIEAMSLVITDELADQCASREFFDELLERAGVHQGIKPSSIVAALKSIEREKACGTFVPSVKPQAPQEQSLTTTKEPRPSAQASLF